MSDLPPDGAPDRAPLSPERIELAALALIEREGLAGFSIRKLAAALGCKAMSIYHYFPSKGHLLDALVDHAVADLLPLPPADLGWRARLRQAALDWRRMVLRRPGLFLFLATHRMNTPLALRWLDDLLTLVRGGCVSEEEAARLFRAIGYYLAGAGLDETAGYARGPSTVTPVPPETMARDYPNVTAAARWFAPDEREATFLRGLDALLDGWAARRPDATQ
ncbi:MAG: TetR/AcrR family transcriptional regulator C-terminal domain-containing protein [Amaricoccus sp.]